MIPDGLSDVRMNKATLKSGQEQSFGMFLAVEKDFDLAEVENFVSSVIKR